MILLVETNTAQSYFRVCPSGVGRGCDLPREDGLHDPGFAAEPCVAAFRREGRRLESGRTAADDEHVEGRFLAQAGSLAARQEARKTGHFPDLGKDPAGGLCDREADIGSDIEDHHLKGPDVAFDAVEQGGAGKDLLRITQQIAPAVPLTVQQASFARIDGIGTIDNPIVPQPVG